MVKILPTDRSNERIWKEIIDPLAGHGIRGVSRLFILSGMMGVNPVMYHNREFALFLNRNVRRAAD
jgi:hypothetical protein